MKISKKKVLSLLTVAACATLSFGVVSSIKTASADEASATSPFDGTSIIGAQVRLDDAGMRFVMEMDADDYALFSNTEDAVTYTAGVLAIPTVILNGAELTTETATAQRSEFDGSYAPKTVVEGETTSYRFNAVLKEIAFYATEISARGYITDGTNTYYTNTVSDTVSRISSTYYVDESYAEHEEKLGEYIVKGYNEVSATDVESVDEIAVAPTLNEINSVLAGKEVEGYSNELALPKGIENVMDVAYATDDADVLTVENGKVSGVAFGKTSVTVNALGKEMGRLEVNVIDDTVWKIGAGYTTNSATGVTTYNPSYNSAEDFIHGQALTMRNYARGIKYWTGKASYVTEGFAGKEGKMLALTTNETNSDFFEFLPRYSKEQIALLLADGYDTIEIPMYYQVTSEHDFNAVSLYTPKSNIDTANTTAFGFVGDNYATTNTGRVYFNEWTTVKIPLQTLYTYYDNMTTRTSNRNMNADSKYDNGRFAWLGLSMEQSENVAAYTVPAVQRTIYLTDIKVTKSAERAEGEVNIRSASFHDSLFLRNEYQANATAFIGDAGVVDTTIGGRTGEFLYTSNMLRRSPYAEAYTGNSKHNYLWLDVDLGYDVAGLTALKNAGYTKLSMEYYYVLDKDARSAEAIQEKAFPQLRIKAYGSGGYNKYWNEAATGWTTLTVSIDTLIDNYATIFAGINDKTGLLYVNTEANALFTFFFDNIQFVK